MSQEITRLFDCPYYQQTHFPQDICFANKENGDWKTYSSQEYIDISNQVSRALLKLGVQKDDKIAVIVPVNQPKWHFLDIGVLQIGAQNVPLYATLSESDYEYVFEFPRWDHQICHGDYDDTGNGSQLESFQFHSQDRQ